MSYDPYDEQVNSGPPSSSFMQSKEYSQCTEDWASVQRYVKDLPKDEKNVIIILVITFHTRCFSFYLTMLNF